MPRTLGYHFVKSGYGLWLPGDERGHWSTAWDERIGHIEPHMLHDGDPVRLRMAEERMKHGPIALTNEMMAAVAYAFAECAKASSWKIAACAIDVTHFHLQFTYSGLDVHKTCKWIADQTTKAIHALTDHGGPVWCKGKWCTYLFDQEYWDNTRRYIERHNERRGLPPRPYEFITAS